MNLGLSHSTNCEWIDPTLSLVFEAPVNPGPIRQGEIIGGLAEHIVAMPPLPVSQETEAKYESQAHPYVIVISADCDLWWDFNRRESIRGADQSEVDTRSDFSLVHHVLLCDLFTGEEIKEQVKNDKGGNSRERARMFGRIMNNREDRFHYFPSSPVVNNEGATLPELIADFKKVFSLPTHLLYLALAETEVNRMGVVPPIYIHNFIHRCYSYLSRVGLPE